MTNFVTLDVPPGSRPSIDDLYPHVLAICGLGSVPDEETPFTAPRYRVGLSKTHGVWTLAWGWEYDLVPGVNEVIRMGMSGYRVAEACRDLIDRYTGS